MYSHIRIFVSITFMMALVLVVGCSTPAPAVNDNCPTISQEAVSACRAQTKCKQKRTSYGFGLGAGQGSNLALGAGESQARDNYTNCIDEDLEQQRAQQNVIEENNKTTK